MLQRVRPRLHAAPQSLRAQDVCRDVRPPALRLLDGRPQRRHLILRRQRIELPGHDATRRADSDIVDTLGQQRLRHLAHLGFGVRHSLEVVEVPRRRRDRRTRRHNARPDHDPGADRVSHRERRQPATAAVAHRGHAAAQVRLGVAEGARHQLGVTRRLQYPAHRLVVRPRAEVEMDVRVDHPRHERAIAQIDTCAPAYAVAPNRRGASIAAIRPSRTISAGCRTGSSPRPIDEFAA